MSERVRPIVLIVCGNRDLLRSTRETLRAAGVLTATARSADAAVALLEQVMMDGCVLCQPTPAEEARRLWHALENLRPGCPRLCVTEHQSRLLDGWMAVGEAELAPTLRAAFSL